MNDGVKLLLGLIAISALLFMLDCGGSEAGHAMASSVAAR